MNDLAIKLAQRLRPGNLAVCAVLLGLAGTAIAGEHAPFTARDGLALATDAANIWAADAELIYLENDEPLSPTGTAARWGYLFHSPSRDQSRGYSLRDGKVLEATDLEFELAAPPLPSQWLDSGEILAAADREAGQAYCEAHQGHLATMVLIRGAFHEQSPDRSTWTVIYTSPTEPSLLVVVDAARGDIVRKWKG